MIQNSFISKSRQYSKSSINSKPRKKLQNFISTRFVSIASCHNFPCERLRMFVEVKNLISTDFRFVLADRRERL